MATFPRPATAIYLNWADPGLVPFWRTAEQPGYTADGLQRVCRRGLT